MDWVKPEWEGCIGSEGAGGGAVSGGAGGGGGLTGACLLKTDTPSWSSLGGREYTASLFELINSNLSVS